MNKSLKNQILLLSLFVTICGGCFEDKGNYNYKELISLEIDTVGKGISPEMTAIQFENFKLPIAIKYNGDMKNVSYEWKIYPQNPQKEEGTQKFEPPIILSTKANFDTTIYVIPNKYYLTLTVFDKVQDLKSFFRIKLNVETKLTSVMLSVY